MNIPVTHRMDKDEEIYANADPQDRTEIEKSYTRRHQTPQHTGDETPFIITHILCVI